ncbi:MAG TPA: hypothetical protein EYP23_05295 [Thermoplasmata archaeon]|nr:hypothetical protein [Thermoplasmata archaeon]
MSASEKIVLFIAAWILITLFVTGDADLEIFFVLITIGFIVAKELTAQYTTAQLKRKMNSFIYVFIIIFTALVGIKIINKLGL